jgi:hypothetical protein
MVSNSCFCDKQWSKHFNKNANFTPKNSAKLPKIMTVTPRPAV